MTAFESTVQGGLARRRLGVRSLVFFIVSASAPMTAVGGGIAVTFAITGVVGMPASYAILGVVLALFAVGYAAMSRYVFSAGAFYAYVAHGLGGAWGVAASFVALVGYNGIQIGLYGLFGRVLGRFAASHFGVEWPWWVWALVALTVVGVLGLRRIGLNARVLSVLLMAEVCAVLLFDLGALLHPHGGKISAAGLNPKNLFADGIGGAFALVMGAYVGYEQAAIYCEEAKDPRRTVARSTYLAVAIIGVLYAVSAWAMTVTVGPDKIIARAREDPNMMFSLMDTNFGQVTADLANLLLVTSIFAALLSFHNGVARYMFALGRERILPAVLGRTGRSSAAPVAGSITQSVGALVVVALFAALGLDPVMQLCAWLTYVGAVGVLVLMLGTSLAVVGFFRGRDSVETSWHRVVAPVLSTIALVAVIWVTVRNSDAMLGAEQASGLGWVLPGIVGAAAVVGLGWGLTLRRTRPDIYARVGRGGVERLQDSLATGARGGGAPPAMAGAGRGSSISASVVATTRE
jgi:amino acid transporter